MGEESRFKTYFWPYDIFGYLLPGFFFIIMFYKGNSWFASQMRNWLSPEHFQSGLYQVIVLLIVAYITGHFIAAISSILLEKTLVSVFLKYPTVNLAYRTFKLPKWLYYTPVAYFRPYSEEFKKRLFERFLKVFGFTPKDENDLYHLTWTYVTLHHPPAFKRTTHYIELYGFSRNISMSLLLLAITPLFPQWNHIINGWLWSIVTLVLGLFMFLNYLKLFRRMNDEMYRAFMVASENRVTSN